MKVKFHVLGCGETSFHSSKTGKDYRRVRLIGSLEDASGIQEPATADLGFECSLPFIPKSGDIVFLDLIEFSMRSAMAALTFKSLEIFPGKNK